MLKPEYTTSFNRDIRRQRRKHQNMEPMKAVIRLVLLDTPESKEELRRRHRAHPLAGEWEGAIECHVNNEGDRLLIWMRGEEVAVFLRTGTHGELFGGGA
jgi:mRNA interferase YafQ